MIKSTEEKESSQNFPKLEQFQLRGDYLLPLNREQIWLNLNDPAVLQQCIKGCHSVEHTADGCFDAVFQFKMGPFWRRLHATMEVQPQSPPQQYLLRSTMNAKPMGAASGQATVLLEVEGDSTWLRYQAEIGVSGWFARLGEALIHHAADRYMKQFFDRFERHVKNL